MEAISVKNLRVGYENNTIIEDMSLSIPKGKISIIIGANGCGKTTISNLLGNFELEKYSDCQVKWANNVAERVFVYNKTFREKNFKESYLLNLHSI